MFGMAGEGMRVELEMDKEYIFDQIMTDYGEGLKRYILTYVKDMSAAEDIVQEVFLKVYLKLDSFEERSSMKTWLYRIAINQCKDYFRSWHYQKVRVMKSFDLSKEKTDLTPEDLVVKKVEDVALAKEILALGLKYREVILLYYYRDFSLEEIALLLNLNPSTVRTRMQRAKSILKKKLGGEDFES